MSGRGVQSSEIGALMSAVAAPAQLFGGAGDKVSSGQADAAPRSAMKSRRFTSSTMASTPGGIVRPSVSSRRHCD